MSSPDNRLTIVEDFIREHTESAKPDVVIERELGRPVVIVHFRDQVLVEELMVSAIQDELQMYLRDRQRPSVIIDFSNVQHFGSAALGMLITIHHQVTTAGGRLVFANVSPRNAAVFAITRFDRVWEFFPTIESAKQALTAASP